MNNRATDQKQMILGVALANNFGVHPATWRMPHIDPSSFTDINVTVKHALTAEQGGLHFVFLADRLYMHGNVAASPPVFNLDPIITLPVLAQATERIGLIGTASTSFTEPYLLARQLKVLDVISRGRAGWNAIPSYEPEAFANFGRARPIREKKYERLHEVIQVVQSLWGSWGYEAGDPDQTGMFANPRYIRPINMQGAHVGSQGPLPVPPSEQGQPVIVMPFSSGLGLQAAVLYADVIIGMPSSIEEGQNMRQIIRQAVTSAGRNPDEVKFIAFAGFTVGNTKREALDSRRALDDRIDLRGHLSNLSAYLGGNQLLTAPEEPLSHAQLESIRIYPGDVRSSRIVELARAGWSPRDILSHGIFDPYPSVVGTATQIADHLQEWYEAAAADGFMVNFDDFDTGIPNFVDQVVPILRERMLFHDDYEGKTLRDHLSLPFQYGIGSHLSST